MDVSGAPQTLRDLVLADLRRAQRLIERVHPDPIDPQFRIASPEGDYWIGITLTDKPKERTRRLRLVSDFMAWKLSPGFVLATELAEPDAVLSVGVTHNEFYALVATIERRPLKFSGPRLLRRENMDPEIMDLLPRGARTITPPRAKELEKWFGVRGTFAALKIPTGGSD